MPTRAHPSLGAATLLAEISRGIDQQIVVVERLAAMQRHAPCGIPIRPHDTAGGMVRPEAPARWPPPALDTNATPHDSMPVAAIAAATCMEING